MQNRVSFCIVLVPDRTRHAHCPESAMGETLASEPVGSRYAGHPSRSDKCHRLLEKLSFTHSAIQVRSGGSFGFSRVGSRRCQSAPSTLSRLSLCSLCAPSSSAAAAASASSPSFPHGGKDGLPQIERWSWDAQWCGSWWPTHLSPGKLGQCARSSAPKFFLSASAPAIGECLQKSKTQCLAHSTLFVGPQQARAPGGARGVAFSLLFSSLSGRWSMDPPKIQWTSSSQSERRRQSAD